MALVGATLALRLPAFLATRHLVFDDGVYGASALAMRDGALPFRQVFSSQGPLFLPLVWLADIAGLRTLNAPRLLSLASATVLVATVWWAARLLGLSRPAGLLAAGLVATSGSVLWVTGPITSDAPALALATLAVAVSLAYRRAPSLFLAVSAGLALGAALSIKSLLLPAVVPVAWALLADQAGGHPRSPGRRHLIAAGGAATTFGLLASVPWGLADVWDQSVTYHLEVAGSRTPGANAAKVLSTLGDRDLPFLLVAVVAIILAVVFRRSAGTSLGARPELPRSRDPGTALVGGWLLATVVVLLLEHPLWRSHVAQLVPAGSLLVAYAASRAPARPARVALGVALAVAIPYHAVRDSTILWPRAPKGAEAAARADLATLPSGAWAISDEPGLVWRQGRRTPADMVDTSVLRIDTGRITAASVAAEAVDPQVCGVLVWSHRFGRLTTLGSLLASQGFTEAARYGGPRVLYVRDSCRRLMLGDAGA